MRRFRIRPPARPSTPRDIIGHIDGVENGVVRGWCASRSRPADRLTVQVLVDGVVAAQDVAALFREDVDAAGFGDGGHGFEIQLPTSLLDGQVHRVEAVEEQSGAPLTSPTSQRRLDLHPEGQPSCSDLLFDAAHYHRQSGVYSHGLDHYRRVGWKSGYDPHPLFSSRYYLSLWPAAEQSDPLSHFETVGQRAHTTTHPLFDPELFLARRPSQPHGAIRRHPVLEYLMLEPAERPSVSRYFADAHYAAQVDLRQTEFSPLLHYLRFGYREGRSPSPGFDPRLFRKLVGLDGAGDPFTWFARSLQAAPVTPRPANAPAPSVSVIVLNHNKALLTLQCLFHLRRHVDAATAEVIVVDNGSASEDFDLLCRHAGDASIIRIDCNRGFGEGCNIGAEQARGEFLFFLNNDAFLTAGCVEALRAPMLADPGVAATGPKLLFADGTLQEAGASISPCGTAVQHGRGLQPMLAAFNVAGPVDYCSAAALLVRASSFRNVLGFDLCWDPAYYEDSDLCLRLKLQEGRVEYVPGATVIHLEHATAADASLNLGLDNIVEVNRLKFVSRWSAFLSGQSALAPLTPPPHEPIPRAGDQPRLGLYTPYPLVPGGGERYLLTFGHVLGGEYAATLQTPDRYSRFRLANIGRDLKLDLSAMDIESYAESLLHPPFDVFVCMGNHLFPSVPAYGTRSFYHCQFPFPMHPDQQLLQRRNLGTYQAVIVNSEFTAEAVRRQAEQARVELPPVLVLPPPVPEIGAPAVRPEGSAVILSVGRFAPGGHCKRQDVMIEEFRRLLAREPGLGAELHLAGSLGPDVEAREYLRELMRTARELPVHFHVNPTADQLVALYRRASVYWHLTGAGADLALYPERAEHFGIAIVEAMSAGVPPVALRAGGPVEIISEGRDGFLIKDPSDLSARTLALLRRPELLAQMGERAMLRARDFSEASFAHRLRQILQGATPRSVSYAAIA